ncbi:amidohydrolase family protein [Longimicrobium sp.]|uniref:amidohydrolase family protein n=1 Tax=Longimicrobium sp. TaxID=2029185 RepID=UPI002D80C890|nr:amidohydrolase family protein [Longimicrobium sp.]
MVAHHQHLLSPALAARSAARSQLPAVDVPAELARVLAGRAAAWNDSLALARVYAPDAVVLDPESGRWLRGSTAASFMARLFARPYTITPVSVAVQGSAAHVAGYYTRPVEGRPWHFGQVLLALRKGDYGAWRVAAETATFPADATPSQVTADQLIAQMDAAGVRRAVVLSLGYSWGSPLAPPVDDEYGKVRAENDWTAREVARYPDRLVAFCGVNPLKEYAVREMERCSRDLHMRGLKLHFGNSGVNVLNPEHVARVREVFRAANRLGMPIVAHLWTRDPSYGAAHSRIFLEQILPEAPDVVVQVAHMTDAGPGYEADAAMAPLAEAVAAGDPRTRNLYFDVASNVTITSPDRELEQLVRRIRQIGPRRILWGSDGGWGGNPPLRQSWGAFHGMLPLTEAEFRIIAGNVAPYLR